MVYVVNKEGKPLMPTNNHGLVRRLIKTGMAVTCRKMPFTIQLTYETTNYVEDVKLGVDCGSKHVGVSATTNDNELYSCVAELRSKLTDLNSTRREFRRARRNRLWHRKARFNNRVASKKDGWLPPSIINKIGFHEKLISLVCSILPIKHTTIEIGEFDVHRIMNPEINGTDYQNGPQKDYYNVRQYVLWRDNHTCQHCHGKSGCKILNTHHIESRKVGGDSPNNLITLCEECHEKYHRGEIKLKIKRGKSYRDAAAMNSMKERLYDNLVRKYGSDKVSKTYGYITKMLRHEYGIEKTHNSDARVISGNPQAKPCDCLYEIKQIRRHDRQIYKSNPLKGGKYRKAQSSYKVFGYRMFDIVSYKGKECIIVGRRTSGYFVINDFDMVRVHNSVSYKKLKFIRESSKLLVLSRRISSHD